MRKLGHFACVGLILAIVAALASLGQESEPAGVKMAGAGSKFVAGLTPEQKAKAVFAFDDNERFNWHFIPLEDRNKQPTRKGLRLEEMTPDQKAATMELLRAGLSTV